MDRNEMLTGKSMAQILFSHARSRPQHLCVADPDEAMTYGQMALRIREKAHALEQLGIRAGDFVVAVCAQRGDYLALEFAVQELGAVFVPVEKRIPREALERVCRIVHPALVVHRPDLERGSLRERGFCYGLRDQIGVLCDGTVVPCCMDHEGDIPLGNLFQEELDEILSSARARAIYDGFSRRQVVEPLCQRCGYAGRFQK